MTITNEQTTTADATKSQEPEWLVLLGKAADGLIPLPDHVKAIVIAALEEAERRGPKKLGPEEAVRAIRRLQDSIAVCGGAREVFCSLVERGGHKRADGTLRTYREIANLFGNYRSAMTYCRWMRQSFPEIARAMREANAN